MRELNGWWFHELADGSLFPVLTGGKGEAPEPTPEERQLTAVQTQAVQEQLRIAKQQQAEQEALLPILLSEYGITRKESVSQADPRIAELQAERARLLAQQPTGAQALVPGRQPSQVMTRPMDARGRMSTAAVPLNPRIAEIDKELAKLDKGGKKTVSYEKTPDELMTKRKEIEGMQLDRSLKALRGELPVTATLAKELELGKRTLAEKLSRQLGPGWETTSAGIQAQAEYDRMATSLREAEQKDQLSTAEALSINRQNSRAGNTAGLYDTATMPNVGAASLFANAGAGAGSALGYYDALRRSKLVAQQTAAQERGGYASAILGGAGLGVGAFLASDPILKTDIEPVDDGAMLLAVRKVPIYKWRYKDDPEKRKHIGGMATDFPNEVSDGHHVDVISLFGLLTGSIRALDKKVSELTDEEPLTPAMLLVA